MKKTIIAIIIVAATSLSLTSCKKDYTCKCDTEILGQAIPTEYPIETQQEVKLKMLVKLLKLHQLPYVNLSR